MQSREPLERRRAVALFVQRPGDPVHRAVGARAVLIDDAGEVLDRFVPASGVERARAVLIVAILVVVAARDHHFRDGFGPGTGFGALREFEREVEL